MLAGGDAGAWLPGAEDAGGAGAEAVDGGEAGAVIGPGAGGAIVAGAAGVVAGAEGAGVGAGFVLFVVSSHGVVRVTVGCSHISHVTVVTVNPDGT